MEYQRLIGKEMLSKKEISLQYVTSLENICVYIKQEAGSIIQALPSSIWCLKLI